MKITFTPLRAATNIKTGKYAFPFFTGASIVCCFLLSMDTTGLKAQTNALVAPVPEISTEDLPGDQWKSADNYATVLLSERTNTALKLADPNLEADQLGLYTGYDRMLSYMQEDLANHLAIGDIALRNFKRVVAETPADAILKYMHGKDFQILYDTLLPKLIK